MTIYYEERDMPQWPEWTEAGAATKLDQVPTDARRAVFYREKASHRGIGSLAGLSELIATKVNDDFFGEICELEELRYLELNDITVEDLTPLTRLRQLRTLKLSGVRKASAFEVLLDLPHLDKLFIENAKHLSRLDFLSNAHRLQSIGVEGSMWTAQKIETLAPLGGLGALDALFMTGVRLKDKNLSYLASCPSLRVLQCARFAPKAQFERLRHLKPNLQCNWCDKYEI